MTNAITGLLRGTTTPASAKTQTHTTLHTYLSPILFFLGAVQTALLKNGHDGYSSIEDANKSVKVKVSVLYFLSSLTATTTTTKNEALKCETLGAVCQKNVQQPKALHRMIASSDYSHK